MKHFQNILNKCFIIINIVMIIMVMIIIIIIIVFIINIIITSYLFHAREPINVAKSND